MTDSALAHEHAHPGVKAYVLVAVILFTLTALEVLAFEIVDRGSPAVLAAVLAPVVVAVLLVLSAAKFALVAMFYMHLKQDSTLFSGLFVFPIFVAAILIAALLALFSYMLSLF